MQSLLRYLTLLIPACLLFKLYESSVLYVEVLKTILAVDDFWSFSFGIKLEIPTILDYFVQILNVWTACLLI